MHGHAGKTAALHGSHCQSYPQFLSSKQYSWYYGVHHAIESKLADTDSRKQNCNVSYRPRKCPCGRFFNISEKAIFIWSLKFVFHLFWKFEKFSTGIFSRPMAHVVTYFSGVKMKTGKIEFCREVL